MCFGCLYDCVLGLSERRGLRAWREKLLSTTSGEILELGVGTGLNIPHYGDDISLTLLEPDGHMRARLAHKFPDASVVEGFGEKLPFDDDSFDGVVMTLVLCSVRSPGQVLREIRRVLRPSGRFFFLEHVGSERASTFKWQSRLEPMWKTIASGCHITRDAEKSILDAGFTIAEIQREHLPGAPGLLSPSVRGVATP